MKRTRLALLATLVSAASPALARPVAPSAFCAAWPEVKACASGPAECTTCHTAPPQRNAFGEQLDAHLLVGTARPLTDASFLAGLPAALAAVEALDADGDGVANRVEAAAGTSPADPLSLPGAGECPESIEKNGWDVCHRDPRYVLKKVYLDFCGRSPTRAERTALIEAEDPEAVIDAALDSCLTSEYWLGRDGAVWNLANRKIRPLQSIKAGEGAGDIPLADYLDDYAYFVYTQTGDRDARETLTGQYFVAWARDAEGHSTYTPWNRTPNQEFNERGFGPAQLVVEQRRAGLLTHRWFLMSNTMFTGVPRTTAAQAYRAFLGLDISRLEGLQPVAAEPVDYDEKGVQDEACARCHSTLDPLTYPFTRYEGIGGGAGRRIPFSYNTTRNIAFAEVDGEGMRDLPEAGVLFGQPVANLLEWAQVAANSDAFARATVLDYWKLLLGEIPRAEDQTTFDALWQGFKTTDQYRVERMLHALVKTEAYGVP